MFFWAIFCPFTPLATQNIEVLKKWTKRLKMSSFYICVPIPKIAIIWWMLLEIWVQHTFFCHFGSFFALLPTLLAPKVRNWKKRGYFLFHMCATNKDSWDIRCKIIWCTFPEIWSSTGKIFSHFGPFFVLLLKNQNLKKKSLEISSAYTCVPQMTIIWCMVP